MLDSENKIEIKRIGSQPSTKGQTEYFTETIRIDYILCKRHITGS